MTVRIVRGYSLMEMIVCLGLLSTSLLLVIGLFLTMTAQTDNDGERMQISGLLEAYQADMKARTEAEWLTIIANGGDSEVRQLMGQDVQLETQIRRLSADNTLPDYQVYELETTARWRRKAVDGGAADSEGRVQLISQMSPVGRY